LALLRLLILTIYHLICITYQLTLERFSSVGRIPTSATEPSVQLDLESATICWWTSNSRSCYTAVSDSRWRRFYFGHSGAKAQCEPFRPDLFTAH